MEAHPPTTTPALCTQYKVYWRECGHEYSNVNDVVPCQAAADNLPCACSTNLRIVRDTTTPQGVDGHTRVLSDGTETGFCRSCRLNNEKERKEAKKKGSKKVDGGSKVTGEGGGVESEGGAMVAGKRNVRVKKKYVNVDGGRMGSKDDWEVGRPPKTIKQYQKDLKMLTESAGRDRGRVMSW